MRIAYFLDWPEVDNSGVYKKVKDQVRNWGILKHEVQVFVVTAEDVAEAWKRDFPNANVSSYTNKLGRFIAKFSALRKAKKWNPDSLYIRDIFPFPGFARLIKDAVSIIEVNSDWLGELAQASKIKFYLFRILRQGHYKNASGMVYVSHELFMKNADLHNSPPSIVIGNGIDLERIPIARIKGVPEIRFLFLGTAGHAWHGIDQILEYASDSPHYYFEMVGIDKSDYSSASQNVNFYGKILDSDYWKIAADCTVAIGTLGLHRKNMLETSPLKTREYLALGLPVIMRYVDTDFMEGAPFILQLPAGESPLRSYSDRIDDFIQTWKNDIVAREDIDLLSSKIKEEIRINFMMNISIERGSC